LITVVVVAVAELTEGISSQVQAASISNRCAASIYAITRGVRVVGFAPAGDPARQCRVRAFSLAGVDGFYIVRVS